ncbi:Peroxiredoxin PRX1 [Fusarium oxysporum f. sp. albedinis]|nr:Peroxiredoxin PRX1 [Fusarium oxysporum f. sp. albedinis]
MLPMSRKGTHTGTNPVSASFSKSSQPALFLLWISFLGLPLLSLLFPPLYCVLCLPVCWCRLITLSHLQLQQLP